MTAESDSDGAVHVLKTPVWMLVVRGFQFLLTLVIAGLAGRLMHDAYLDEEGLALAMVILPTSAKSVTPHSQRNRRSSPGSWSATSS